jgi:hypothetical protein
MKESEKNLIGSAFHILQGEIYINAVNHGFYGNTNENGSVNLANINKGERIALMHSELSEALEGIRKDLKDEHLPEFTSEEVELADCMIRILDHAEAFGLRLFEALIAKHEYNVNRPFMHGKKF